MYDSSRAQRGDGLTEEERNQMLDDMAEHRYIDFESGQPTLGPSGAAIGFDDTTNPISKEFGEFYSTPRGYHPNSITQFTVTSSMSFMNFPLLENCSLIYRYYHRFLNRNWWWHCFKIIRRYFQ